jgi:GDSL-like Lipase/Acylhydrolase family
MSLPRAISREGWIALGLYVVAFVLLSGGGWARQWWLVVIAAVFLVAAAVLLQRALQELPKNKRLVVPALIIGVGVVAIGVWGIGSRLGAVPGGVGLAGFCAVFLGIGHLLTELRSRDSKALLHGVWISCGSAAAFGVGLAICLTASSVGLVLVALGLLTAPVGMTMLSEGVLREPRGWVRPAAGAAVLLVPAGAWAVGYALQLGPLLAVLLVLALGGLILAIASSTLADVLLLVTIIGLFWASQPSGTASDDLEPATGGQPALVALGDSYISGEGASEFLEGTNDAGGNQCRRAPQAYPRRIFLDERAGHLERLAFLACSGAETDDLRAEQLPRLKQMLGDGLQPRLVVVSVGGNDAGFASIATACIAPGSCADRGQLWLNDLPSVARKVYDTYVAIRETVGMDVPVLAVPYPVPIRERPCQYSAFGADESRFLQRFVVRLDRAIGQSAESAGVEYLGDMREVLTRTRLRVCDRIEEKDIGINLIRLKSVSGAVEQLLEPRIWLHNSFHPNETGHEQMSHVLARWIANNPSPPVGHDPTGPPVVTGRSLATVMEQEVGAYCGDERRGEPDYCGRGDVSWALAKVAGAFGALTPALLFIVGGWWALALLILQGRRTSVQRRGRA